MSYFKWSKLLKMLFFTFLLLFISIKGFSQASWIKKLPIRGFPSSMIKTSDGGFACLAVTDRLYQLYNNLSLIKCDSLGNAVWVKKLQLTDSSLYFGASLVEVSNLGYAVLCNYTPNTNLYAPNGLLFFTDLNGDTLWTRSFFDNGSTVTNNTFEKIQLFNGTSLLVMGGIYPTRFLTQVDFSGNIQNVATDSFSYKYCHLTNDLLGNTIVTLTPYSNNTYGFQNIYDLAPSLTHTNDHYYSNIKGEFAECNKLDNGLTYLVGTGDTLIKLNSNHDSLWTHPIQNFFLPGFTTAIPQDFKATNDGGFIQCGYLHDIIMDQVYLLKTDSLGNLIFKNSYNAVVDNSVSVVEDSHDGFVMFQSGNPDTTHVPEMWLVKTDPNGILTSLNYETKSITNKIKVFPNPAVDYVNLQFPAVFTGEVKVLNIIGNVVQSKKVHTEFTEKINVSTFPSGVYFISCYDAICNKNYLSKFIIIK